MFSATILVLWVLGSCSELRPSLFKEVLLLKLPRTRCLGSLSTAENQKVRVTKYEMLEVRKGID